MANEEQNIIDEAIKQAKILIDRADLAAKQLVAATTSNNLVSALKEQIRVNALLKDERKISDSLYAPIIVKVIVFGLCALSLTAIVGALIKLILIQ